MNNKSLLQLKDELQTLQSNFRRESEYRAALIANDVSIRSHFHSFEQRQAAIIESRNRSVDIAKQIVEVDGEIQRRERTERAKEAADHLISTRQRSKEISSGIADKESPSPFARLKHRGNQDSYSTYTGEKEDCIAVAKMFPGSTTRKNGKVFIVFIPKQAMEEKEVA
jgi:hypothetical protein